MKTKKLLPVVILFHVASIAIGHAAAPQIERRLAGDMPGGGGEMAVSESDRETEAGAGGWLVPAQTPLRGIYAGASVAPVFTDYSDTVDDGSVSGVNKGDVGIGFGGFLGYNFNEYLGMEAGFTRLENVDYSATSDGSGDSWAAGQVSADFEADVFVLVLVGRYPVAPRWTLIGKIGFLHWETVETFTENGFVSTDKDDGNSVMVAGGIEYDIGVDERFKLRGELGYQRFNSESLDMAAATLSLVYEFP